MKSTMVPGPPDINFEEVAYRLRREPIGFVTHLLRAYGDIVRVPFGTCDLYFLGHPDFIREMFVGKAGSFAKRKNPEAEQQYLGVISGFAPLFEAGRIPGYAASMARAAAQAHERWHEKFLVTRPFKVDIYREICRVTLELAAKTIFGVEAQNDAGGLLDAMLTMDYGYGFDPIESTLGVLMPEPDRKITAESKEARDFIERYVLGLGRNEQQHNSGSFLGSLVQSIGLEAAVSRAMMLMLGMHEVTATTMSWTSYHLAESPEIDATVAAELTQLLHGRQPHYDDIPALSYMNMCLSEARRLYPSVWIAGRFVRKEVSFGEYSVPAGSIVMASQYITHRDSRFYRAPDKFDPMRWTPEAIAARPEFSYFPFSAGRRACAGEAFAEMQDLLVFATLAQHWQGKLAADETPKAVPQKSSAPWPAMEMVLTPRRPASAPSIQNERDQSTTEVPC